MRVWKPRFTTTCISVPTRTTPTTNSATVSSHTTTVATSTSAASLNTTTTTTATSVSNLLDINKKCTFLPSLPVPCPFMPGKSL